MLSWMILLAALSSAWSAAVPKGMLPHLDGRIVGGEPTYISVYPWQISLQRNGGHSCGGSIYTPNIIVTAAHCLQSVAASALKVRAGSTYWNSGGVLMNVESFKNHEGYNSATMINDIAIIKLAASLSYSSTIKPIPLAEKPPLNGAPAVVSGWGTKKSGSAALPTQLQAVHVDMVGVKECGSDLYWYGDEILPTMICAASPGKDACQGDSGGPLVSDGLLVGVVSWGYGCAFENLPGVYADVSVLHQWVVDAAENI